MTSENEFYPAFDDYLPPWAIGVTNEPVVGAQLCTRDGRRVGNAVVVGPKVSEYGFEFLTVLTDAGNMMKLTESEISELFWPPHWLMDPATAPGQQRNKALSNLDIATAKVRSSAAELGATIEEWYRKFGN